MRVLCARSQQDIMFTEDLLMHASDNNYTAKYICVLEVSNSNSKLKPMHVTSSQRHWSDH